MIKGTAIFFLTVYLMGATPLGQFGKLPSLINHFQKHQYQDKSTSLIDFLSMHYFNGNNIDADHDEDMKLPFKTIDVNTAISSYTFTELPSFKITKPVFVEMKTQQFSMLDDCFSNSYLDAIWQPPRVA